MDKLVIEGINHKGFGTIPKAIMLWPSHDLVDENGTVVAKGLHNTAKAICGYILCYSGGGSTSFPGRDKICNDLGIKSDTDKSDTNINKSYNTNSLKEKEKHQQQIIVDDDALFEIEKEYTKITGRKDLSTRALKKRIGEITGIQITVDYLREKLVVLEQKLDQTNNPAAFLIAAIKEDWRPAPEQEQPKIEVAKCPNCHQAISACVCEKPESPETVELYAQARQAAEVLGVNGSIFTRITATNRDGKFILAPSASIFLTEVKQAHFIIDRVMKHLDKPYVLNLHPAN
ncbi:MAG: hypothetical protein KGZ63_08570 [Clostridiales bacterium]|nr:hypothetical protein [Clostridiales bacterium]